MLMQIHFCALLRYLYFTTQTSFYHIIFLSFVQTQLNALFYATRHDSVLAVTVILGHPLARYSVMHQISVSNTAFLFITYFLIFINLFPSLTDKYLTPTMPSRKPSPQPVTRPTAISLLQPSGRPSAVPVQLPFQQYRYVD